jgi:hypothetical protein
MDRLLKLCTGEWFDNLSHGQRGIMSSILPYLTTISILSVLAVLGFGLYTMMHGKSPNLSQNLMRWRVGLQFLAIVMIMAAIAVKRSVS